MTMWVAPGYINLLVVLGLPCAESGFRWVGGGDPPQLKVGQMQAQVGALLFSSGGWCSFGHGLHQHRSQAWNLFLPMILLRLLVLSPPVVVVAVLLSIQRLCLVIQRCAAVWLLPSGVDHECAAWG
jgi:hypothetical protein